MSTSTEDATGYAMRGGEVLDLKIKVKNVMEGPESVIRKNMLSIMSDMEKAGIQWTEDNFNNYFHQVTNYDGILMHKDGKDWFIVFDPKNVVITGSNIVK